MTLKNSSTFTGAFNPGTEDDDDEDEEDLLIIAAATGGTINLIVESGSKVILTDDSYITSLYLVNSNDIDYGDYSLTVGNSIYTAVNPYSGAADQNNNNNNNNSNDSNDSNGSSSSGGNGTNGSSSNVVQYVSENFLNSTVVSKIQDKLGKKYDVVQLYPSAFSGSNRSLSELAEAELFTNGQIFVYALPLLKSGVITKNQNYVFSINIATFVAALDFASNMHIYATKIPTVTMPSISNNEGVVHVSDSTYESPTLGIFLDDSGKELKTAQDLLDASKVNVAVYLESNDKFDYSIVIAADDPNKVVIGPSGAGCNVGYAGMMTLLACVAFIMKKK